MVKSILFFMSFSLLPRRAIILVNKLVLHERRPTMKSQVLSELKMNLFTGS
jgi:hypothetical protein